MTGAFALAAAALASEPLEAAPAASSVATGPSVPGAVPMRIPAILRLQGHRAGLGAQQQARKDRAGDSDAPKARKAAGVAPGGKRRRRRWENAQLAGNPHLHRPSRADFAPGPSLKNLSPTFSPPPAHFSRSTYVSSTPAALPSPAALAAASTHGHFSMSLRGLRRTLRQALGARGGRSEEVVSVMERELVAWLALSGRIPEGFFHDSGAGAGVGASASLAEACARGKTLDATPVGPLVEAGPVSPTLPDLPTTLPSRPAAVPELTELARQPHTLVWLAPAPHTRFLLHALARYYRLASFSRPLSPLAPDVRVTHVLRPQIARARVGREEGACGIGGETPPGTDWTLEDAGGTTTDGGLTSDVDADADLEEGDETDTDAVSVLSAPLEADEDDDNLWEATPGPAPVAGGTDDEAEAVYSSATESSAEDTGAETGIDDERESSPGDALARRFAALGTSTASATPTRLASPLSVGGGSLTPRARVPPPPFSPFARAGSPATPLARPGAAAAAAPARGRRSLPAAVAGGYSSAAESSPSRSPTRAGTGSARTAFLGVEAGEWRMPEKDFIDWVYE
ncbi:hypothetical protein JCM3770_002941 [Rhodotorula araucariae]